MGGSLARASMNSPIHVERHDASQAIGAFHTAVYVAHDAPQLRDRARARAILFGNQYILHQIKPE
jgi:hypothetical protein